MKEFLQSEQDVCKPKVHSSNFDHAFLFFGGQEKKLQMDGGRRTGIQSFRLSIKRKMSQGDHNAAASCSALGRVTDAKGHQREGSTLIKFISVILHQLRVSTVVSN